MMIARKEKYSNILLMRCFCPVQVVKIILKKMKIHGNIGFK